MSLRLINLVIEHFRGDPGAKLALIVLANHADDRGGRCYPSINRIAERVCFSAKHTRHLVHQLIESGFVTVEGNERGGRAASRRYRINVEKLTLNPHPEVSDTAINTHPQGRVSSNKHSPSGESKDAIPSPPGTNTLTPRLGEPLLTNYTHPCKRQQQHQTSTSTPDANPAFLKFWTAYPKKRGKQDAYRAWETLQPDAPTAERIVQHVERAAATHDWRKDSGRFVPLPANYLSGRRFDDELAVTPPHRPQMVPL